MSTEVKGPKHELRETPILARAKLVLGYLKLIFASIFSRNRKAMRKRNQKEGKFFFLSLFSQLLIFSDFFFQIYISFWTVIVKLSLKSRTLKIIRTPF